MPTFTDALTLLGDRSVPFAPAPAAALSDEQLLHAQRSLAEVQRRVQAQAAVVAAEIAHRSRRELGHGGLAASHGRRSAEELISTLAGTSTREARTLVLLPDVGGDDRTRGEGATPAAWLAVIGTAVATAGISAEAARVIRSRLAEAAARLDEPVVDADAREQLDAGIAEAAQRLVDAAAGLTIEQLAIRASHERDELDLAGIPTREETRREKRYLRVHRQLDGITRIHGLLDPESAADAARPADEASRRC